MIEIDRITKIYADTKAVDSVSMTVETGTITVIVGTSGSGKTTVKPHILRRRIGYAIQGHGLFPHHTVARNIGAVPQLLKWSRAEINARVDELLALFSMEPKQFRDRYPAELSGGQQQRVGVARALASRPDLLLMDEPFGALDPIIRNRAQEDLRRIQQKLGSTIMLVTHDMEEAILLGDRVAVMDGGKLVQHGTPAEIITRPATAFVANMVGDVERPLRLLSLIPLGEVVEPGAANGDALSTKASLRDALSACLWTGREAVPVENDGVVVGRVTLDTIRARAELHA